jgi:hypothetical protein
MKKWLEPELEKEPDRTYFWKLVDVIRKAEGKESLFETTHERAGCFKNGDPR